MKTLKIWIHRFGLFALPMTLWAFSAHADARRNDEAGEPVLIVEDLSDVGHVLLPTPYVKTSKILQPVRDGASSVATYQFILDFKSGMIFENPDQVVNEPLRSSCVGDRLEKIKNLIWKNQICDFSKVKQPPPSGTACLTVIYPDYMILPLPEGNLGVGTRSDSCALPERDLCRLSEARLLRSEIESLTSDFATQIEEGSVPGDCL
ncbi:MAG TPA: hypothetical protein PL182_07680 [Pseudobdellovibrionaceae bacterium]|nr:hypothetical protein [Pseudobdellovibrionaceae bacterium]